MKRELSATPTPSSSPNGKLCNSSTSHTDPQLTPKKAKSSPKKQTPRKTGATPPANGSWTAEKREELMTDILVAGIASLGTRNLADKYGVSMSQMSHALQAGRKGNLRDKAILAVKGEDD